MECEYLPEMGNDSKKRKQAAPTKLTHWVSSFFPVQLLLGYLKYNHLILLTWLFPFLITAKTLGTKFGLHYLFLAPEYLGSVNARAFLFFGLATGSFIMAFHLASYVVMVHRFPFIVTTSRPFYRYSVNNSLIPLAFLIFYLAESASFQWSHELIPVSQIAFNLLAFLVGVVLFIYVSFGFFYLVVKVFPRLSKTKKSEEEKNVHLFLLKWWKKFKTGKKKKLEVSEFDNENREHVRFYMRTFFKAARTRHYSHYDKKAFSRVFHMQHRNALLYVLFILAVILIRGTFKDHPHLIIPAGASLQLIFTIIILISSLTYILFERWTFVAVTTILLIASSPLLEPQKYNNNAYGLHYPTNPLPVIDPLSHGDYHRDSLQTISILNKWLQRNTDRNNPENKPTLVVISTSGGGLKMAVWTYYSLAYADSCMSGKLLNRTELITGASGGMIGAAYLRELYRKKKKNNIPFTPTGKELNNLSKDILNPVFYTFSMSDWFFRMQKFRYAGKTYFKDRAYMFEQTVNRNLGPLLDKPLYAYRMPELNAEIPMMILSPAIENNGSRMLISPLDISYMTKTASKNIIRNIELRHNYAALGADSLRFLTALRMNASFPYVSPDVGMPGKPRLVVMDAGLNDNFGYTTAFQFIVTFSEWIKKHTSGVVLLQIRENTDPKIYNIRANLLMRLLRPMGSLFDDWSYVQEVNYEEMILSLNKLLPDKFHTLRFSFGSPDRHISLSWHLTAMEKKILLQSINLPENKKNVEKLKTLIR